MTDSNHTSATTGGPSTAFSPTEAAVTFFYDGTCPLCSVEIGYYRRRRGAEQLNWVDVSACPTEVMVDRIIRLLPKRLIGRSTKLLNLWFDSVDGWDSSVSIEPLVQRRIQGMRGRCTEPIVSRAHLTHSAGSSEWVCALVPGLSRHHAINRFHVRDAGGRLISGGQAFAVPWSAVPAFAWVGRLFRARPLAWAIDKACDGFLVSRTGLQALARRSVADGR